MFSRLFFKIVNKLFHLI